MFSFTLPQPKEMVGLVLVMVLQELTHYIYPLTVNRCVVNAAISLPHIILPIGVGDGGLLNAPHKPTSNGDGVST
jgi:hypothetical protein